MSVVRAVGTGLVVIGLLHMLMRRARTGCGSLVIEGSISHASFPQVLNYHYVITLYNFFLFALFILLFSPRLLPHHHSHPLDSSLFSPSPLVFAPQLFCPDLVSKRRVPPAAAEDLR